MMRPSISQISQELQCCTEGGKEGRREGGKEGEGKEGGKEGGGG